MKILLLDSNVLLRLCRNEPDDEILRRLDARVRGPDASHLATSAINVLEVASALRGRPGNLNARLEELLRILVAYPVTARTALLATGMKDAAQKSLGSSRGGHIGDSLVLAVAQEHSATLVTEDQALLGFARAVGVDARAASDL